jgi:hypothetical protein
LFSLISLAVEVVELFVGFAEALVELAGLLAEHAVAFQKVICTQFMFLIP